MYKLFCTLLILVTAFPVDVVCQTKSKIFRLEGEINSKLGTIILLPIGEESYYPDQMKLYEAKVENNQFSISNPCLYPYAFQIGLKVNSEFVYVSDIFWVEPGDQKISCNIDSSRVIPIIRNITMNELARVHSTFDLDSPGQKGDAKLLEFTKANLNSYISLWKLVDKFSDNGYQES